MTQTQATTKNVIPLSRRMKTLVSLYETKLKNLQDQIDLRDKATAARKDKLTASETEIKRLTIHNESYARQVEALNSELAEAKMQIQNLNADLASATESKT